MATVIEIQVCGSKLVSTLKKACQEYLHCLKNGTDREKLHFCIVLATGETRSITIRQEDNEVVAYGDFEGLPNALEWAQGKE